MWFDGIRQPNTLYIANTSRGKDSTAMLRAIQLMGWPLDAVCSVDIWFDDDTPAELPPMVAFKDEYDQKVLEKFGIPVTRLCATKREREREREYPTVDCSTHTSTQSDMETTSRDSQQPSAHGASYLKTNRTDDTTSKLTYTDIFYREIKPRGGGQKHIYGYPIIRGNWCTSQLKQAALRIPKYRMPMVYRGAQDQYTVSHTPLSEAGATNSRTMCCAPFIPRPRTRGRK